MPANFQCPYCGTTYQVTDEQIPQYSGQGINCSKCGKPFTVPADFAGGVASVSAPPPLSSTISYASPQQFEYSGNGMAITALICGILGFIVPLIGGVIAIILGILVLQRTRNSSPGGKGMAIAGIVIGGLSMLLLPCLISIMLPSLSRARETANRIKCAANMRSIGLGLAMYANENRGAYPPGLENLITDENITPENFTCPSGNDTPAPGSTLAQQAQNLSAGKHLSYIYLGGTLNTSAPSNDIVLYEPLANHSNDGCNFLFNDGHVEFMPRVTAQAIIAQLQAGQNPPPALKTVPGY